MMGYAISCGFEELPAFASELKVVVSAGRSECTTLWEDSCLCWLQDEIGLLLYCK